MRPTISLCVVFALLTTILLVLRSGEPTTHPEPADPVDARYEALVARAKASGLPIPPREGLELRRPNARKGIEVAEWHYTKLHYPYGPRLPRAIVEQMLDGKKLRPDEDPNGQQKVADPWEFMGPSGMSVRGSTRRDSGRVTDIEWRSDSGLRVASANGGLWRFNVLGIPEPMADDLDVLCIGSFDSHPTNPDVILVGTGDPDGATGAGLYRTINAGVSWTKEVGDPNVDSYYDLRYSPWTANEIHAATSNGHYRFDSGSGWNPIRTGMACTSIAFNPDTPGVMLGGFRNDGIYTTTNSGDLWVKSDISTIVPDSLVRRVSVAVCNDQPQNAWALISRPPTPSEDGKHQIGWLLRSSDGGLTWTDKGLPSGFPTSQGDYNHVISVHPKTPTTAIVGGITLWRTTNDGADWTKLSGLHADHHVIEWRPDGATVYNGNDGGLFESTDAGASWSSPYNYLPITQFYSVDVCATDPTMVTGGAQDNGVTHTLNLLDWEEHSGGDGGGVAIDPENCNFSVATTGVWGKPLSKYRPQRSSDIFGTLEIIDNGLDPGDEEWTPWIRAPAASNYLYLHDESDIFRSSDNGDNWNKISGVGILLSEVLTAERTNWGAVYVCTTDEDYLGMQRAWVIRDGIVSSVDDPIFPDPAMIKKISPHPKLLGTAYAIVSDATTLGPGASVYMTENWGADWEDVSLLLTDVIPSDVLAHPDDPNQIYVGTALGVVWTPNRGSDWLDWDLGMPSGAQITELVSIPTGTGVPGEYWIYASTFGRGMWRRKITAAAPGAPDLTLSSVEASGGYLYSLPDGSGETLADNESVIRVQIVDSERVPVPGIAASRLTLGLSPGSMATFCETVQADAATDDAGWTTFSGALPMGGNAGHLRVQLDGSALFRSANVPVRTPDINNDLRVDLCDLEMFTADRQDMYAVYRSDLDGDGDVDIQDGLLLDAAMEAGAHCPTTSPLLSPAEGELGLWFDTAGTQFGQLAQSGDYVDLYLVARNFSEPIRALEFQIPALAHPAVDVTFRSWNFPEASFQSLTGAHEFQLVFGDPAPFEADLEVVLGMIRIQLQDDVRNLRFCIEPMPTSSFGAPAAAGWTNATVECSLTPFASTSCAEINPFPGDVWAGFEHETLGPAILNPLGDHLALQGLGTTVAGGVRIYFGGRNPGTKRRAAEPDAVPLDGAAIFFGNALPAANLPEGASFELGFGGAMGVNMPVLTTTVVLNSVWVGDIDMSAIGSEQLEITLINGGQELISSLPFDGAWQCDEILPEVAAAIVENDRLHFLYAWDHPVSMLVGGNQYMVEEMHVFSEPGLIVPKGLIAEAVLTGSQLPDVLIGAEAIQRYGNIYAAIDNVFIKSENDRLRFMLEDPALPGQVRIEELLNPTLPVFTLSPAPHETEAKLVLSFQDNSDAQSLPMTLEVENGVAVRLRSDMSQVGAQGWVAQGYSDGIQQWQFVGSGFDIADVEDWPICAVMTAQGIQMCWSSATTVSELLPKSRKLLAPVDMMEIIPQQPATPLPSGTVILASFTGIASWPVVEQQISTPAPRARLLSTQLLANVPNPFNPMTDLRFSLAREGRVRLEIFDERGRLVRRLLDGIRPAGDGVVRWNGSDASGSSVASGIYFVRLEADGAVSSRKISLIK